MPLDMDRLPDETRSMARQLARAGALSLVRKKLRPRRSASAIEHRRYESLEHLIFGACADARFYQEHFEGRKRDPCIQRRVSDSKLRKELKTHVTCVRRLKSFIRKHRAHIGRALAAMHYVEGVTIKVSQRRPLPELWYSLFEAYEKALQPQYLAPKVGLLTHLTRVGPLDLGHHPGERGASIKGAETGLLFQLALFFRRYTSGIESFDADLLGRLEVGERMPDYGKPHWELCAELLGAALGATRARTAEDIGRRMNRLLQEHPQLSFVGWPQQRPRTTNVANKN